MIRDALLTALVTSSSAMLLRLILIGGAEVFGLLLLLQVLAFSVLLCLFYSSERWLCATPQVAYLLAIFGATGVLTLPLALLSGGAKREFWLVVLHFRGVGVVWLPFVVANLLAYGWWLLRRIRRFTP
jgi:hypothetical protein